MEKKRFLLGAYFLCGFASAAILAVATIQYQVIPNIESSHQKTIELNARSHSVSLKTMENEVNAASSKRTETHRSLSGAIDELNKLKGSEGPIPSGALTKIIEKLQRTASSLSK